MALRSCVATSGINRCACSSVKYRGIRLEYTNRLVLSRSHRKTGRSPLILSRSSVFPVLAPQSHAKMADVGVRAQGRWFVVCLLGVGGPCLAQTAASIRGKVTLANSSEPIQHAHVLLIPSGKGTMSSPTGEYEFNNLPPGRYELVARMSAMSDDRKKIEVKAGETAIVDFALGFGVVRQEVTVTATGKETSIDDSFQTVTSRDSYELLSRSQGTSLGDLLENETGIAKRSSGPGSSRPVVRGFDGDRVLMLQDGTRTGTLSYQSGDHGEPVDVTAAERVEVVRGPATLLYGSNAIGGVVNVISNEHVIHEKPHDGLTGKLTGLAGSNNGQAQGGVNLTYGHKNWLIYGAAGGVRAGDYKTPLGVVLNSGTDMKNGTIGFGRFGEKTSFHLNFQGSSGKYGVPFPQDDPEAERSRLDWKSYSVRLNGVIKKLGDFIDNFEYDAAYTHWNHAEKLLQQPEVGSGLTPDPITGTEFFNKTWTYQGVFHQRKKGPLTGSFGFWGLDRGYESRGAEALSPPVKQGALAGFVLEELDFEKVRFQFGTRVENNRYQPASTYQDRSFTGASVSGGVIVPLWKGGSVFGNYMHSYRAPALEELYNHGPHPGNNVFEIGDPTLTREMGDSLEVGLRHNSNRFRFSTSLYRYQLHDYVYLEPDGRIEDGLPVANYRQADSRFLGAEARTEVALHPSFWLLAGFDTVDAQVIATRVNLPRIPPVRGRAGFDWRRGSLSLRPELVLSNRQWQVSEFENPTAGYAVVNFSGNYTLSRGRILHMFSLNVFNATDRLYRNHLSFVKEFAPEIGRGVRLGYTFQWF